MTFGSNITVFGQGFLDTGSVDFNKNNNLIPLNDSDVFVTGKTHNIVGNLVIPVPVPDTTPVVHETLYSKGMEVSVLDQTMLVADSNGGGTTVVGELLWNKDLVNTVLIPKDTTYGVKAKEFVLSTGINISYDNNGNLVFTDILNPASVTLTELLGNSSNTYNVLSEIDNIAIQTSTDIDGTIVFTLVDNTYSAPTISVTTTDSTIYEVGNSPTIHINVTSTKGRDAIISRTMDNGITLANITFTTPESFVLPNITTSQTWTGTIKDSKTTNTSSLNVNFYYPFLTGNSNTGISSINPYTLTKEITAKSSKSRTITMTNSYYYFCYPTSYGTLSKIYDGNGFDVTSSFSTTTKTVISTGLTNNWSISYTIYYTPSPTDINNQIYKFNF